MHQQFRDRFVLKEYGALIQGHVGGCEGEVGTSKFRTAIDFRYRPWMTLVSDGYVDELESRMDRSKWVEGILKDTRDTGGKENVSGWRVGRRGSVKLEGGGVPVLKGL